MFSCGILFGETMKNKSYILATGTGGQKALELQQAYLAQSSYSLLEKAGLKPGMVVYDVGCGAGSMTVYLAQMVGSAGWVFAIDVSEEQLKIAQDKVQKAGLSNVTFIQADVQKLESLPTQLADIVYFRYLLVHLPFPDQALQNMYACLKTGGKLVFQEPTWKTIFTNYPKEFLNEYRDSVIKLGEKKGVNYNIGRLSPKMSEQLPGSLVQSYEIETKITLGQYKDLGLVRLSEIGAALVSAEIVSAETLLRWQNEIKNLPTDGEYFVNLGNLTCVWVEKSHKDSVKKRN